MAQKSLKGVITYAEQLFDFTPPQRLTTERLARIKDRERWPALQILKRCSRNDAGYFPAAIRRAILGTLTEEWLEWHDLLDAIFHASPRVYRVLDFLEEKGRIEAIEVYYHRPFSTKGTLFKPTLADRMIRPTGEYRGYQWAYRLKSKSS